MVNNYNKIKLERIEKHLCIKCGELLPENEKRQHCKKCREKFRLSYQDKKEKCKQERICFSCGKKLTNKEIFKCVTCAEKIRLNQYQYNKKVDRKPKSPSELLCIGGCGTYTGRDNKYCPVCKKKSLKENHKRFRERLKQKKAQKT